MNANLGYVIWGVKNGFQNNIFSHNLTDTIKNSLVDIQSLCMPQYNEFYSISRVAGFTLVSLYNPDTRDFKGRKAYIVFSILFPSGIFPAGDIFELLNKFKKNYMQDSSGIINPDIFYKYLMEFSVTSGIGSNSPLGSKIGYKIYSSNDEIKDVFRELEILDFQKVYFFDKPDSYVTNNPNFIEVTSLERKYNVQIQNYNPHDFIIKVNGIRLDSTEIISVGQGKIEIKNLRKTDKIDVFRGGNQTIHSFYVKDQQLVTLPLPKIEHQGYFTIRGLDPTRYRVKVNGQEQPTSHMSGSELKIAISTEHVVVEIIDKATNAIIQTHDTRINKPPFVMMIPGGNSHPRQPVNGGNSGGSSIGFTEEPKKKKIGLILTLCSVVLLVLLGITGWQLGWIKWGEEQVVGGTTTTNAEPTKGTGNVTVNPQPVENSPLNPEGYIVKSGREDILTEKGLLHSNNRYYRYVNGKWEYSEKSNKNNWNTASKDDIDVMLDKYFDKNKTPSPTPPPTGPTPPTPKTPETKTTGTTTTVTKPSTSTNTNDGNECMIQQAKLKLIENKANDAKKLGAVQRKNKKKELNQDVNAIRNSTSCTLNYSAVEMAISNLN
jgi:hypothetical protein